MQLSHFFIERPIFAIVVSVFVTLVGAVCLFHLPIAQYPEVAPPTIQIVARLPGASAETMSRTVSTPLEQEINGVEKMLYINSQSTGDGRLTITVTFKPGTDLDIAQTLTQNRVAVALPRLPATTQRLGVSVKKASPDLLMVIHLISPNRSLDQLYMSNYATLHVRDVLSRLEGVGDVQIYGEHLYAMRIWLDPGKIAERGLSASAIVSALQEQNTQVAAGVINQSPVPRGGGFEFNIQTEGRLTDPSQFADIIVASDPQGRVTRVRDIGHVALDSQAYGAEGFLDNEQAVPVMIYQQPGTNALETGDRLHKTMDGLSKKFPHGLKYEIVYDTTIFVGKSLREVADTILIAIVLVAAVVVVFLQTWRASLIPILAIPVSLVGSATVLLALGFTLNTLSLFGMILAVGIVVDDAIVVVENVERHIAEGLNPKEATHKTADEVGGALIAIALALCAVFIPSAFVSGISGQFFKQFAVTIAASTLISCFVSLTLSSALCTLLLRPHGEATQAGRSWRAKLIQALASSFNGAFAFLSRGYRRLTAALCERPLSVAAVYCGVLVLAGTALFAAPTGFIPDQDLGYLITVVQLPPGASVARTDAVIKNAAAAIMATPGVAHSDAFAGFDAASNTNASNFGAIFAPLEPFEERLAEGLDAQTVRRDMERRLSGVTGASIITIPPPPVSGIGNAGGFKMVIEDEAGLGLVALEVAAQKVVAAASQDPRLSQVFTTFTTKTPTIRTDIDRVRAEQIGVKPQQIFNTLEIYLGSAYINDFNYLGRTYQVLAQADGSFRNDMSKIGDLKMLNIDGRMVPIGSVASSHYTTGPYRVPRYNLFPAAEIQGLAAPGTSSAQALVAMEALATKLLPEGMRFEWTELAYQQATAPKTTVALFAASLLSAFLVLAAHYESWRLPFSVILVVPTCVLAAVLGLLFRDLNVDLLAQIGLVVLIGLGAKNAILIVEFAKSRMSEGMTSLAAAKDAAQARLRPILMTSCAFILGVAPLATASGAGAEMRRTLGTAMFWGMIGVTLFALAFTPVFFVQVQNRLRVS